MEPNESQKNHLTFGVYSSFLLSFLTIVTFGFAMTAMPPSGPYCPENCMSYPFPDILLYYPRDYYWMYLAIFQLFSFVIFVVTNHFIATAAKKLYTLLSISFTLISSTVLLIAYFTQFSVVPISVMKGETEGIALITQYNEHGLFIAMEELGYITMSIALFFLAFAFSKNTRTERIIRLILISQFFLNVIAFSFYSIKFGIERSYFFEVATITINWVVIIFVGILAGVHFVRKLKVEREKW
ncbi:MAG: hypothetical protein CVT92_10260 [Bacteroidetes bacterium HGW-Bacteroidetes-1]|jgi:hypothetical protein|nr:MAG: hypothetical protein CVT92_10260 [Bacteroidetes bacterium HGW-Bacteroidetes-1]